MTRKPNFRRGMTMAEILICVAVVAIAVVMVVSFSVSMGGRTRRSNAQLEAREELELVESVTRSWLNAILTANQKLTFVPTDLAVNPDWDQVITAVPGSNEPEEEIPGEGEGEEVPGEGEGGQEGVVPDPVDPVVPETPETPVDPQAKYTFGITYGNLVGSRPGGEDIRVRLERVTSARFFVVQEGGDALFYCRVTYQVPMSGSNQMQQLTHVFCINPHIGE